MDACDSIPEMEDGVSDDKKSERPVINKLVLDGMSCGSCERLIERVVVQNRAQLLSIDAGSGTLEFIADPEDARGIKEQLALKGFRERKVEGLDGEGRGDFKRVLSYARSVLLGDPHVEVENRLFNYAVGSAAILLIASAFVFGAAQKNFDNPVAAGSLLLFAIVTGVMSVYSISHMDTYRKGMTCANGMMVGMTTGMASGYMVGAILGATNGMFVGSVAGTAVGIAIGFAVGRYSGIMGAMEGIMAGLMSGTMGAMTTFMMLNDHMLEFLYILAAICMVTVGGLSYMMYREAGPAPRAGFRGGFARFLVLSGALNALIVIIMLIGPKGPITYL